MKCAALLVFCLVAAPTQAQQKAPIKKPIPTQAPASSASEDSLPTLGAPLAPNVQVLQNYSGDPIEIVVFRLKPYPKDAFETTAEYNARVAAVRPTPARAYSFWLDSS